MKKTWSSYIEYGGYGIIAMCYIFGCQKTENIKTTDVKPEVIIQDSRTPLIHFYSDTVYILQGELTRIENEELIIDAGTLVKAISDDYNNLGGIKIAPGGVIRAEGTKENPIVFTSNIYTGNQRENWKGITIQGKAKDNMLGNIGDSTDFSGSLKYVRIEFASLTLNAVGNKTAVENIMVSYANTSGQIRAKNAFNFLGGSVNAKNLFSYACAGAADFYVSNGYNGKMQNLLALRNPLFGDVGDGPYNSVSGLYIENNANGITGAKPFTNPVISNLTVIGPNNINGSTSVYSDAASGIKSAALVVTGNANFFIGNALFMGFPRGGVWVDDGLTADNIEKRRTLIANTIFQASDSARTFYLEDGVYPPYNSYNLQDFLLNRGFNNQKFLTAEDFKLVNPFNYDQPNLLPSPAAAILSGADFSYAALSDPFFTKFVYRGALGDDNWLTGWTNFLPLRTNYNFPQ